MIIVSNTSPLRYLLLIDEIELLPQLYGRVMIPQAVYDELSSSSAPALVQNWIARPPDWLAVQAVTAIKPLAALEEIDVGEREAILLAEQLGIHSILLDDLAARKIATKRGLKVIGLLGILRDAATENLVDLPAAIAQLRETNFRVSSRLIESLLERYRSEE